jgi:hypothetical protein
LPPNANSAANLLYIPNFLLGLRLPWKNKIWKSRSRNRLSSKRGLAVLLVDEALKTL